MRNYISLLFFFLSCTFSAAYPQLSNCIPGNLRCEYLISPIGVDAPAPRLSWLLIDQRYGAKQIAYRILVGTDSLSLKEGTASDWDSKRIESDRMQITYEGRKLQPFTRYYWSLQTWDKDGLPSEPVTSSFETGMLGMENWKGNWISDGESINAKPAPYFRKEFRDCA